MLILFDNGTPRTLARFLVDRHTVTEARARGWEELENGELLDEAEAAGFEVLVTTDKNLGYAEPHRPQDCDRSVRSRPMDLIKPHVARVIAAVNAASLGSFAEVEIPHE